MYIILTLFLGIAAVNTGNNLIYLIVAALLSFLAVSGFFGRHNLKSLRITYKIPDEVYAGRELPLFLHLHNERKYYPAFLLNVFLEDNKSPFPYLAPRSSASTLVKRIYDKRGWQRLPEAYIASPFPFHFFIRYKVIHHDAKIIVFPNPQRGEFSEVTQRAGKMQSDYDPGKNSGEGELVSVRNYRPGDPLRFIHWKATARTDRLKTKDLGTATVEPLMLDFHILPGHNTEKKLSFLCYQIQRAIRDTRPVGLKIGGATYGPGQSKEHKLQLMKALALYGTEES